MVKLKEVRIKLLLELGKKSKRIKFFWEHRPIWCIPFLCITFYRLLYLISSNIPILFSDSTTYIDYPFLDFVRLHFASGRTPVYPFIILVFKWLLGDNALYGVVFLQLLVSLASTVLLYKAVSMLTKNKWVSLLAMLFYGCTDGIIGWDGIILTESFALSGTIAYIYLLLKYLEEKRIKHSVLLTALTFMLVFLRPSFLIFYVVLGILFLGHVIFEKKFRKDALKSLLAFLIGSLLILIYSGLFMSVHGIFSISDPMPRQQLINCMRTGLYAYSPNEEFVVTIEEAMAKHDNNVWLAMWSVLGQYGNARSLQLSNEAFVASGIKYWEFMLDTIQHESNTYYASYITYSGNTSWFGKLVLLPAISLRLFTIGSIFVFSAIQMVVCITIWLKTKRIPWFQGILFGLPVGIIVSTFLSTCDEYMRTSVCALPFLIIGLAMYVGFTPKRLGCII